MWLARYLEVNLLLALGYFFLLVLERAWNQLGRQIRYAHLLQIARAIFVAAIVLPMSYWLVPKQTFLTPSAQIWSATSMRENTALQPRATVFSIGNTHSLGGASLQLVDQVAVCLLLIGTVFLLLRYLSAFVQIRRLYCETFLLRSLGRIEVRSSDRISIPFSFWIRGILTSLCQQLNPPPQEVSDRFKT